jgi:hypothetical protein
MQLLLGIDDTDQLGHKPGTGRLARELGAHLERAALARLAGVVRHQLLVDPRIPYTSHNSPACLILNAGADDDRLTRRLYHEATRYVVDRCAPGSDPGLCLARREAVPGEIVHFACRAGSEVVAKLEAVDLAARAGLLLEGLGGTGDGVIGALAAVGLTVEGNGGRFLELAGGMRELGARVSAATLRELGIALISISRNGEVVPADAWVDVEDWVRPRLIGGRPVLFVQPAQEGWVCFDRKNPDGHSNGNEG